MKTQQLLLIKSNEQYIRAGSDWFEFVEMDKASVYPLDKTEKVLETAAWLKNKGVENPVIHLLTITEQEFSRQP